MAAMLSSLICRLTLSVFLLSFISTILYIVLLISINRLDKKVCQSTCFQSPGVPSEKVLLEYYFLYASYRLCDSSVRPVM